MRYLTLAEGLDLHRRVIRQSGGGDGIRELGGILSALAQPEMTFGGSELYPTIETKAAALCYSLVTNHPFIDGNKRIGHAAMEAFLILNGFELEAPINEAEQFILRLASGQLPRDKLVEWLRTRLVAFND